MAKNNTGQKFLLPLLTLKENGGGIVALTFAKELQRKGYSVTIISSDFHGIDISKKPEYKNLNFIITRKIFSSKSLTTIKFLILSLIRSVRFKERLVYTYFITGLIPNFSKSKPFMLMQDIEYRFFSKKIKKIVKILFVSSIKKSLIITTSNYLKNYAQRLGCNVFSYNELGISEIFLKQQQHLTNYEDRSFDFFLICKSGKHKSYPETFELAKRLALHGYKVHLLDQTRKHTDIFTSYTTLTQEKMLEHYSNTKVFISLSKSEGYGLTPLEAYACNCKVISTNIPSIRHIQDIVKISKHRLEESELFNICKNTISSSKINNNNNKISSIEEWAKESVKTI